MNFSYTHSIYMCHQIDILFIKTRGWDVFEFEFTSQNKLTTIIFL